MGSATIGVVRYSGRSLDKSAINQAVSLGLNLNALVAIVSTADTASTVTGTALDQPMRCLFANRPLLKDTILSITTTAIGIPIIATAAVNY